MEQVKEACKCSVDMVPFLGVDYYFKIKCGEEICTNTRAELICLWELLYFAKSKEIN